MRTAGLRALMLAGLGFAGSMPGQAALSPEEIYERISPSVLTLEVENSEQERFVGAAFLVLRPGLAVTAWHVVHDAQKVEAWFPDRRRVKVVGLVAKDERLDLALIEIEAKDHPRTVLSTNKPRIGTKAFVIGAPKGTAKLKFCTPAFRQETTPTSLDVLRLDSRKPATPWPVAALNKSDSVPERRPLAGEHVKSDPHGLAEFRQALAEVAGKKVTLKLESAGAVQSFTFEAPRDEREFSAPDKK